MRILYHHRIGSKDGQYVHIEAIVSALRAQGHEVRVVGPGGFDEREFGGQSAFVARLRAMIPGVFYEMLELAYNLVDYRRLARHIGEFEPDVLYERYNLYLLSGTRAQRVYNIPLLVEVNAPLQEERNAYGGLKLVRLARWAEGYVWRKAAGIFTVTQVLADRIVRAGVSRERIQVTPNGVDRDAFALEAAVEPSRQSLGVETPLVVGFVGFARQWHGLDAVIRLLAAHEKSLPFHFLLVGDGPACESLRVQAAAAGVAERLTITGLVERTRVAAYLELFDIALQPAAVAYASPLKLLEYMASGCAIVAPDQPNIRELIEQRQNGLLFDAQETDGFERAVLELLQNEPLRRELGRRARDTIEQRDLSWSRNAQQIVEAASRLIQAQRRAQPAIPR